jgi:hypothetical protein
MLVGAMHITRLLMFLTPSRTRLLGGIRQAFQSATKEGYRGFIALFCGALPGQTRRMKTSGSLVRALDGVFHE